MMDQILYKATRPDGKDFFTGAVDYAGALRSGEILIHPAREMDENDASTHFSVSTEPAETLINGKWPCRLFRVETIGDMGRGSPFYPHKRSAGQLRVLDELPAWQALGPNGLAVTEFIESIPPHLKNTNWGAARDADWVAAWGAAWFAAQVAAWDAARLAARDAARLAAGDAARLAARDADWVAAWGAARDADWVAAWGAARDAARDAVSALMTKDLITETQFSTLMRPWRILTGTPVDGGRA